MMRLLLCRRRRTMVLAATLLLVTLLELRILQQLAILLGTVSCSGDPIECYQDSLPPAKKSPRMTVPAANYSISTSLVSSVPTRMISPPPTTTTSNTTSSTTIHGIPKIIWMYWDRGLDHLAHIGGPHSEPNKYQADYACVKAWQILHPTWEIRILNQTQAKQLAPKFARLQSIPLFDRRGQPIANHHRVCRIKLANLLRTELLTLYGGVYTDTSICPLRPLEDYLGQLVGPTDGFYAPPHFQLAGAMNHSQLQQYATCHVRGKSILAEEQLADPARMIDNFFLASSPGNLIMKQWMQAYHHRLQVTIQKAPRHKNVCFTLPYYIHQCTFTLQVLNDPAFEHAWTVYRNRVRPHEGYWQHDDLEGICYGGEPNEKCATDVQHVWNKCFWVKKQESRLLEYVRSPAYHQDISTGVKRGLAK